MLPWRSDRESEYDRAFLFRTWPDPDRGQFSCLHYSGRVKKMTAYFSFSFEASPISARSSPGATSLIHSSLTSCRMTNSCTCQEAGHEGSQEIMTAGGRYSRQQVIRFIRKVRRLNLSYLNFPLILVKMGRDRGRCSPADATAEMG